MNGTDRDRSANGSYPGREVLDLTRVVTLDIDRDVRQPKDLIVGNSERLAPLRDQLFDCLEMLALALSLQGGVLPIVEDDCAVLTGDTICATFADDRGYRPGTNDMFAPSG